MTRAGSAHGCWVLSTIVSINISGMDSCKMRNWIKWQRRMPHNIICNCNKYLMVNLMVNGNLDLSVNIKSVCDFYLPTF